MARMTSSEPDSKDIVAASNRLAKLREQKAAEQANPNALALLPNHIALCIDASGSMDDRFPDHHSPETRLDCANAGMQAMVAASDPKKTAYTVIAIDSYSKIVIPQTTNYMGIQTKRISGGGGTDGAGCLRIAKEKKPTRIVVLTDGEWPFVEECFSIAMRDPLVPIDTIAIGSASDDFLMELSKRTGGIFKRANNKDDLKKHFIMLEPRHYLQLTHG